MILLWVFSSLKRSWRWWLPLVWAAGLALIGVLMWGGVLGLPYVENGRWGGLILTLLLASFGIAFAFPLSILLALGRRSRMPVLRAACIGYIELIRGVPLISVLFMASVMLPLFLPAGMSIDKLLRAQFALILFAAAYLAEVVRGGAAGDPAPPGGNRRRARLRLLEQDAAGGAAAGAAAVDPAAGKHLHRLFQGHLAGADHRPL